MSHASKCSSVTFWKIYQELLSCMVSKIFAFFGLCNHVYSFMALTLFVWWLAMSETTVLKSIILKILILLLIPWNYLLENHLSWNIIKYSINIAYIEGFYSRLGDKSGKLRKESLRENLEHFSKNPFFETCPVFKMDFFKSKEDWNGRTSFFIKSRQCQIGKETLFENS
jgi:lipopolysaccharide export system protein LptC